MLQVLFLKLNFCSSVGISAPVSNVTSSMHLQHEFLCTFNDLFGNWHALFTSFFIYYFPINILISFLSIFLYFFPLYIHFQIFFPKQNLDPVSLKSTLSNASKLTLVNILQKKAKQCIHFYYKNWNLVLCDMITKKYAVLYILLSYNSVVL